MKTMQNTVLFVDDEPHLLEGMVRRLRPQPYSILTAESAMMALELLKCHDVDLVISDHCMPGLSGIEFLEQVRIGYPLTTRIMLTGQATLDVALDAINRGGVSRLLVKPCDGWDLELSIRESLQHAGVLRMARSLQAKIQKQ